MTKWQKVESFWGGTNNNFKNAIIPPKSASVLICCNHPREALHWALEKLEINYAGLDPIMGTHEDVYKEVCGKIKN